LEVFKNGNFASNMDCVNNWKSKFN
jgi:hypothetical protein